MDPLGTCPPTNEPLTHLADINSCVYFFVCHNGQPLLMPRCRTGHIWDGTRCREGVCEDLPPATTVDPEATTDATTPDPDATTETAETAPPEIPTAPGKAHLISTSTFVHFTFFQSSLPRPLS